MNTKRRPLKIERAHTLSSSVGAGAMAGLGAGVLMAAIAMANSWASGLDFWLPMKNIAAVFFGIEALLGGFWIVTSGLLLHLFNSALFGALFGALVTNVRGIGRAVFFGLLYGAGLWAVMTYLVLPEINPIMLDRVQVTPGWWFTYHMVFGIVLGMTPYTDESMIVTGAGEDDVLLKEAV